LTAVDAPEGKWLFHDAASLFVFVWLNLSPLSGACKELFSDSAKGSPRQQSTLTTGCCPLANSWRIVLIVAMLNHTAKGDQFVPF
jgi:hypothetical protein